MYSRTWETLGEYIDLAEQPRPSMVKTQHSHSTGDPGFYGRVSWAEAVELARYGWREGAERVERLSSRMRERVGRRIAEIDTPQMLHDVAGSTPDVGAYLAGEPEPMLTWALAPLDKPTVTVLAHMGMLAGTSLSAYERRGAATAALIDLLEHSGVRVEVIAFHAVDGVADWRVIVKRPDMPLDLDRLAFVLAHPASHRRINFAVREQTAGENGGYGASGMYGGTSDIEPGDALYVGMLSYRAAFGSEAEADDWIIEQLRKNGIEV